MRTIGYSGLGGAVLLAASLLGAAPASATEPGVASLGSAHFTEEGSSTVTVAAQGACSLGGPSSVTAPPVSEPGVRFGGGSTNCATSISGGVTTTKSEATGRDFELSALVSAGGKRIRIKNYDVSCSATPSQSSAAWNLDGMTGLDALPSPTLPNHVQQIRKADGQVLAEAVFNEQTVPGDGSIGLNLLHIKFLPASGFTGDVIVGSAACSLTT
ncbi:hypothetical protein [Amycolatopsis nigrescens]|uniref:hypothetical protein n=1 Tax=Amycolatopsis nigrescens TaxID=381445 RepID=UPI0003A6DDA7|nr:hypothetical protein [Amycolatopsis nigrescens]